MAEKQIEFNVLKVFDEKQGRNIIRLQVVRWGKYSPTLEKREYYRTAEDEERTGKAKGFNHEDFKIIMDNAEEIHNLLEKETK